MITATQIGTPVRSAVLAFFALAFLTTALRAQVGNNNPTGPAGAFNGNITTGCSYDPLTGNATRTITDLVLTGSVGSYPLAFTRTANSREQQGGDFGQAGGWRHSYAWEIDGSETSTSSPSFSPTVYPVYFPDGRLVYFTASSSDNCFRGPPGVRERFQPLNQSTLRAYLIFPDGGKVEFKATRIVECDFELHPPCTYSYSYQVQAIIDPYGLRTTLSYYPDGSLNTIQEPAGRWLQLTYVTPSWSQDRVIDHVLASDGRVVQYNYSHAIFSPGTVSFTYLESVVYPFEPALNLSPTAFYTYQAPNGPNPNGYPLLASADDPQYAGPMKKISYTYATVNGDPLIAVAAGQILSENNGNTGQIVSRLYIPFVSWRNEIRGDSPSRHLEYDGGYLWRYTDFVHPDVFSTISYDANRYVWAFTNARGKTTTTLREGLIGAVTVLTHPDPEQSNQRFAYRYVDGAPYFLEIRGDERNLNSNTYFTRDPVTNRVTKIWYPDYDPNNPDAAPTESFTYNGFGQIETHTMTSGGVENFRYDGRGLMYESWPPATPSDPNPEQHKTRYFYYTGGPQMDRLWYVIDPRGYSTRFEYNTRGQVTKLTHDQDGTYTQNGYNADGTLAWTADENHPNASWNVNERTRYIYDDYKRVVSVTNPLNKTFNLSYAPPNGAGSYSHTTTSVYRATSPLNKITTFDYDGNFRRKMVRQGTESPDDDGGTWFGYDEVGNLTSVQDPRGNITAFGYDERDRRISSTAPAPFNNQITEWKYDTRSNLIRETRPDLSFRRMEYDPQNRVIDTYGFAGEPTHYKRDLAGNVIELTDPKPATYFFGYDKLNRKTSATYPLDATNETRSEGWHYDFAGNMDQYTNPAGQTRTLGYDTRNRFVYSSWNAGGGPALGLGYYDNSQLGVIETNNGETRVVFGYDDANRQIWEEQTVAGFPTRRIETPRDDDGFRGSLSVPGWYGISYDYTKRGQLANIYAEGPYFSYRYDTAGNMTKRQNVWAGVNDSTNIMDGAGVSQYDALNRPVMWEQTGTVNGTHDSSFARSHFQYDNLGRLTASWRDEQENKGEWYGYHVTGPLTGVAYNADQVWTGAPQNATRSVDYYLTPDTLNRSVMIDSGEPSSYTPNGLNQYENVAGGDVYYDGNFNLLWTGGLNLWHDSANRLTWAQNGEDYGQFVYDGLGRCLKRTVDWETTLIAYDGWKPIVEWDVWDGQVYFKARNIYGAGPDEILYRHDATRGDLRYHLDRMGNVAFLLDADGDGIERYTYDAFGQPTVTDWNGENPRPYSWYGNRFMFTGREYFPGLGLYDYRNRFYHPVLGRFLQSDPIGFGSGDANLFRYCGGDPVNRTDPSGLVHSGTIYRPLEVIVRGDPVPYNVGNDLSNFVQGAQDWGSLGEVLHYLGGGDHQGGPSGETGGHGIGHPFDSGVTDVTYGPAGVVVNFIYNPIDTLFWFGPGSPFGGLENSVFGGLVLTGYANNSLRDMFTSGGSSRASAAASHTNAASSTDFLSAFRAEYRKYNLNQTAAFFEKAAWVPTAAVAAPLIGHFGLIGLNSFLMNQPAYLAIIGGAIPAAGPVNWKEFAGNAIQTLWENRDK